MLARMRKNPRNAAALHKKFASLTPARKTLDPSKLSGYK